MERYLGMDVHARSSSCCVLDAAGKLVRRDVVETNGRALVGYVKLIPGNVHVCIEEGEWSQWLVEILTGRIKEIVVLSKAWKPGAKSDALDAHELAERIRTGRLDGAVYKDPRRYTDLRELARAYAMVTQDVARTKNRLKSFYRGRGVDCAGETVYSPRGRSQKAQGLPASMRQAVEFLGQELDGLQAVKAKAEAAMVAESHRHKIARLLETAPGLGPVRVAQLLPIVITPHRFRTKRQFWAYCGFGVVVRSSADWVREDGCWIRAQVNQTRGLNFNHNRRLKAIFKGAATTVIVHTRHDPLREDYERLLVNGTKPNLARLTIARKIAAIVLTMWKREERYSPERYRETSVA